MATTGKVVVLAGSGISTDQPSGLLTWQDFNQSVLNALVGSAARFLPDAAAEIESLSLDDLPVQAFSAIVAGSFADSHYLPVLDVLEGDRPNSGHHAIASLAKTGVVRSVLTTNFDTLIEQACTAAGIPFVVAAADRDYADTENGRFQIHKLHGSVGRHDTLIDTVHQKLPGLSTTRRVVVREVCEDADVVVLGFSGADFAFDRDYIPLSTARRVLWVTRPGRPASERVREVLAGLPDGRVIEMDIVPCLQALGAVSLPAARPATRSPADRRAEVRERLVGGPNLQWGAAAACLRLARAGGRDAVVVAIVDAVDRLTLPVEKLPFMASSMLRALTFEALRQSAFAEAVDRATREVAFLDRWIAQEQETRNARGLRAGALFNRAQAWRGRGDEPAADTDLQEALRESYAAGARELRAPIFGAQAASITDRDPDLALSLLRAAEATAIGPGAMLQLTATHAQRAGILIWLGEYDAALTAADRLDNLHEISGDPAAGVSAAWYRALVGLLRGSTELGDLVTAVQEAPAASLRGFAVDVGRIFSDGSPPEDLAVAFGERGIGVALGRQSGKPAPPEMDARTRLRRAELTADRAEVLACLGYLAHAVYFRGVPDRLLDLATAYRSAAERDGDPRAVTRAVNLCAVAHDLMGDIRTAADLWRAALTETPDAFDVEGNLGRALSRLGEADVALRHLQRAKRRSAAEADAGVELRVRWYLAEHERQYGDSTKSESMLADTVSRAVEVDDLIGANKLGDLLQEWRSQPSAGELGVEADRYRPAAPPSEGPRIAIQARELRANDDRTTAEQRIMDAYRAYEQADDLRGMSACLNDLAGWRHEDGDTRAAIDLATEALDLRRRVPDLAGEVLTLGNIASWALLSAKNDQDLAEARDAAMQAIEIGHATGPSRMLLQAWTVYLVLLNAAGADKARIDEAIRGGQAVADTLGTRHADARVAFDRAVAMRPNHTPGD